MRRVQAEERRARRGRLKVFLGYASRVGKSFRMLDEGRRRKERGEDVVVASIQFPLTPDLEALMATLEYIPVLKETYAGKEYRSARRGGDFPPPSARVPGRRIGLRQSAGHAQSETLAGCGQHPGPGHLGNHRRQSAAHRRAAGRRGAHHRQAGAGRPCPSDSSVPRTKSCWWMRPSTI